MPCCLPVSEPPALQWLRASYPQQEQQFSWSNGDTPSLSFYSTEKSYFIDYTACNKSVNWGENLLTDQALPFTDCDADNVMKERVLME